MNTPREVTRRQEADIILRILTDSIDCVYLFRNSDYTFLINHLIEMKRMVRENLMQSKLNDEKEEN